jgi:hypothetical protein
MRAHRDAARVALVPLVSFALAAALACQGSDEEASTPTGPSDPIQVNLESITVDEPRYDVLYTALQDEYQAEVTYGSALEAYGEIRPFTRTVLAEGRHVSAVARLIEKRGLPVPPWDFEASPIPADFSELEATDACAVGYQTEIDNVTMYAGFIAIGLPADVESVFLSLQNALELNHKAAFSRCM